MAGSKKLLFVLIKFLYLYCLLALLMVNVCFCLYEDQVGMFDWRQQYIGNTKEVYFEQISQHSKKVFVSTEANVLAALNARTGQIMWRKIFEKEDGNIDSLLHNQKFLITVSGKSDRTLIRSWDRNKGNLLWEASSSAANPSDESRNINDIKKNKFRFEKMLSKHHSLLLGEESGGVVSSTPSQVVMLSQADGSEIWSYNVKEPGVTVVGVTEIEEQQKLVIVCVKENENHSFINFKHVNIETGKLLEEVIIMAPWLVNEEVTCELVDAKYFVCVDPKTKNIFVKNFSDLSKDVFYSTEFSELAIENQVFEQTSIIGLSRENINNLFVIRINLNFCLLAKIGENRRILKVRELRVAGLYVKSSVNNKDYIFEISKQKEHIYINAFESTNLVTPIDSLTSIVDIENATYSGSLSQSVVYSYSKKKELSYRILVISEDNSISLIQNVGNKNAKVLWTREEGLSKINHVKMIELPPAASASKLEMLHDEFSVNSNSRIFSMFINRVKSQIRQFKAFAETLRKRQRYGDMNNGLKEDYKVTALSRDQFNIVKMIIAVTDSRKVFAINSQNGEVIWSKFLSSVHRTQKSIHLFEQRTTAHFPLPPQCFLIASYNNPTKGGSVIFTFNPLNGKGLEKPYLVEDYEILHVAELPYEDEKSAKMVAVVDTEHKVHIYPNTNAAYDKLHEHFDSIYVYLVKKTENTFKGYKIHKQSNEMKLYEVWSVNIPEDQVIISLTTKRTDEVVNSVGRVLGDLTVLFKYLNPNVLVLITQQGSQMKGSIFIYMVDAVTGHVIYSARHKGASLPVEAILSEHWLIYLHYNTKGRRYEVSVVELYEGYEEKNHTAFSSLDPVEHPMSFTQSYLLPVTGVRTLTATNTLRGITNKNILIGLDNGYIYSIPKNFIDPRRNFKQTPVLQEEGLPPYVPELPLFAQAYINYNQTVERIQGIHTTAAGLESTSLVFAYGLDLFSTRVTPSKMFDVLKEDFDYIFISGVLSALILASIICSKLASMRTLKLAWQ